MKLLIVDDQRATLKGLADNIPWQEDGFDVVDTAANAMEARLSFGRGRPEVMLCDIEMPVENGIEFCRWVRQQGYGTKIIFLTCHADFQYAREAIELGASDYIVQPAAYETIRAKVKEVAEKLWAEARNRKWQDIGKSYAYNQKEIGSSLWHGYLLGTVNSRDFASLPSMPDMEGEGFLVLIQVLRWTAAPRLTEDLMASVFQSFAEDIFGALCSCVLSSYMETNTYALLIQAGPEVDISAGLGSRLQYLADACDMYMPCEIALYPSKACAMAGMPKEWRRLINARDQNITGKKGVLGDRGLPAGRRTDYRQQAAGWKLILEDKGPKAMEEAVRACLDQLAAEEDFTADTLACFSMDFHHLLVYLWEPKSRMAMLQQSADWQRLAHEAMRSVDQMKELIHQTLECYAKESDVSERSVTEQIVDYINENLWGEIRKENITEHVHLNGDYISRVFKKEMGISIKAYTIRQKLLEAQKLLRTTSLSVSNVAVQLGYGNFSHFSAAYKREFGITPTEEREKKDYRDPS